MSSRTPYSLTVANSMIEQMRAFALGADGGALGYKAQAISPEPDIYGEHYHQTGITQGEAERHLQAYGGTDAIDHVMRAVRAIYQAAVGAEYHFERESDGEKLLLRKQKDHPDAKAVPDELRRLLEQPNPWQDWHEFLALLIIDYLLVGNAYVYKFKARDDGSQPLALYRLAPPFIEVLPGEKRLIEEYGYKVPGMKDGVSFKPHTVIHHRLPNPLSPNAVFGMGLIAGAPKVFDVELGLVASMRSFFMRGAKLAGVLSADKTVPDPIVQKVKRQFRTMYANADSAYQVAVLEKGLKFQSVQPTAAEAAFEALSKMSRDRIYIDLGVVPKAVGWDDGSAIKLPEARRMLAEDTVQPLLDTFARRFTQGLTSGWGLKMVYDYGYAMPDEDRVELATKYATLPGVTIKDVRGRMGEPPLGPDKKTPDGQVIDDIVLNLPGPSTEGRDGHPDQPLGDEPGRPPNPENTKPVPQKGSGSQGTKVNGRPPSAADIRRRERTQSTRGEKAMAIPPEVLATADPAALVAYAQRLSATGIEEPPAPDDHRELMTSVLETLEEGKALKKVERMRLVGRVEGLAAWSKYRGVRENIVNHLAEGVRRGYNVDQIVDGVANENYEGLRGILALAAEDQQA